MFGVSRFLASSFRLARKTRKRMVETIAMRPITPATVAPMIMGVGLDWFWLGPGGVEDADVWMFPTVDSGRFKACVALALTALKTSSVTTSRYAHAGTVVPELISFGYLSSDVNSCLKTDERSSGGRTWILRPLN